MKTWARKTLSVGVLAAGALLFAPSVAHADVEQSNGDNNGILNGTQLVAPISVPVNITGNALGILGTADARGVSGNVLERGRDVQSNGDNNGILNGTQAYLPVNVPLNVVGNSGALAGFAQSTGVGANTIESTKKTESGWWGGDVQSNGDNNGIGNGSQLYAPVNVPVNVCGNSLAVLGGAFSQGFCSNDVNSGGRRGFLESGWQSNGDNNGIGNGSQLYAPISLPLNLSGNSAALLGSASSRAVSTNRVEGGAVGQGGHGDGVLQSNRNNNGFLNGTQLLAPISVPINICGNSLGILGGAHSSAHCGNSIGHGGHGGFGGGGFGGGFGGGGFLGGAAFFDDDDDFEFIGTGWDDDECDDWGHGKPGHWHAKPGHKGHKPVHKPGHNKPNDVLGDRDDKDDYLGDRDVAPDDIKDDGYGNKGAEPDDNAADDGYGGQGAEPDAAGSPSDSKGGRDKADKGDKADKPVKVKPVKADKYGKTEVTPVDGLTDTTGLGGLPLLSTLR